MINALLFARLKGCERICARAPARELAAAAVWAQRWSSETRSSVLQRCALFVHRHRERGGGQSPRRETRLVNNGSTSVMFGAVRGVPL